MIKISPDTPEYQHNETVTFSCPNGYGLFGDPTGLCQFGNWEISLDPSCHLESKCVYLVLHIYLLQIQIGP